MRASLSLSVVLCVVCCTSMAAAASSWPPSTVNATWPDRWMSSWFQSTSGNLSTPLGAGGIFMYDWSNRQAVMINNRCPQLGAPNASCAVYFAEHTLFGFVESTGYACKVQPDLPLSPPDWVYGLSGLKEVGSSTWFSVPSHEWTTTSVGAAQYHVFRDDNYGLPTFSLPLGVVRFGVASVWLTPHVIADDASFPDGGKYMTPPDHVLNTPTVCPFAPSLARMMEAEPSLSVLHMHTLAGLAHMA